MTWDYRPVMLADMVACRKHEDGLLTLTVEVMSPQNGTDCLFVYELTVRPLAEGRFQYVSNRVLKGDPGEYVSRLEYAQDYVSNIF